MNCNSSFFCSGTFPQAEFLFTVDSIFLFISSSDPCHLPIFLSICAPDHVTVVDSLYRLMGFKINPSCQDQSQSSSTLISPSFFPVTASSPIPSSSPSASSSTFVPNLPSSDRLSSVNTSALLIMSDISTATAASSSSSSMAETIPIANSESWDFQRLRLSLVVLDLFGAVISHHSNQILRQYLVSLPLPSPSVSLGSSSSSSLPSSRIASPSPPISEDGALPANNDGVACQVGVGVGAGAAASSSAGGGEVLAPTGSANELQRGCACLQVFFRL